MNDCFDTHKLGLIKDNLIDANKRCTAAFVMSLILLILTSGLVVVIIIAVISSYKNREIMVKKPAIYVYANQSSDKDMQNYTVSLTANSEVKTVYPKAIKTDNNYKWNISVDKKQDSIFVNNDEYSYLFWDGKYDSDFVFNKGFCVKGSDTEEFLEEKLYAMGLESNEVHDFVVYWLPQMNENEYNLISFTGFDENDDYNKTYNLDLLDENGNSVGEKFRVIMIWTSLNHKINIEEQELPVFNRPIDKPFMVEWGGQELD